MSNTDTPDLPSNVIDLTTRFANAVEYAPTFGLRWLKQPGKPPELQQAFTSLTDGEVVWRPVPTEEPSEPQSD